MVTRAVKFAVGACSLSHTAAMSLAPKQRPRATLADLLAIPEAERFHEIIDGELVEKAMPSGRHGGAQAGIVIRIGGPYARLASAYRRRPTTRMGTPFFGRSVAYASGSTGTRVARSKSARASRVASTIGASMSEKWLPMQTRGPAPKGR